MNSISEIKNTLEGMTSRLSDTEEHISDMEDRIMKISTAKRGTKLKNENDFRDLQSNIKHTHIHIMGVTEEVRRRRGSKIYLGNYG